MNFLAPWVVLDAYSLILLAVCLYGSMRRGAFLSRQRTHFTLLLFLTVVLILADGAQRSSLVDAHWIEQTGCVLSFGLDGWFASLWLAYAVSKMGHTAQEREKQPVLLWFILLGTYGILNMALGFSSPWTGWFFTIDATGICQPGPLNLLHALGVFASILTIELFVILNRKDMVPGSFKWIVVLPLVVLFGGIFQITFDYLPLEITGMAISLQLLYIFQVNRNVNMDFLTDVGNRRMLEEAFDNKIRAAQGGKKFSAVIVDLDSFKQTNDTYGHVVGDRALVCLAHVLKSSFRTRDYVTRFGGDEFCVICDIADYDALEQAIHRLRANIDAFNATRTLPFDLSISIGYGIFDPESGEDKESFRERIDTRLYREKYTKSKR